MLSHLLTGTFQSTATEDWQRLSDADRKKIWQAIRGGRTVASSTVSTGSPALAIATSRRPLQG